MYYLKAVKTEGNFFSVQMKLEKTIHEQNMEMQ